jgi:hypothetical protein
MQRFLLVSLVFVLSSTQAWALEKGAGQSSVVWGVAAGSPQLIALTLETHLNRTLRFQASFGTIVFASAITGRLVLTRISGNARPYAFVGGGLFNVSEGDGGGALGTTGFFWGGGGMAVSIRSMRLFGEIGIMGGQDEDKGFESPLPAIAVGILFGP